MLSERPTVAMGLVPVASNYHPYRIPRDAYQTIAGASTAERLPFSAFLPHGEIGLFIFVNAPPDA